MAYPKTAEARAKFWLDLIEFSRRRSEHIMRASDTLVRGYFNEANTEREADISNAGSAGDEDHVRMVKTGLLYGFVDQTLSNMLDREPIIQCFPEKPWEPERSSFETVTRSR